jgi:hypothetical protein
MEWLLGIGLFLIIIAMGAFLLLRGRNPSDAPALDERRSTQDEARRSVSPTRTRSVVQSEYRFDGKAIPQFHIVYVGDDGARTGRTIYVKGWSRRRGVTYFTSWCFLRDEERIFRSDRIIEATLENGRPITDIAAYLSKQPSSGGQDLRLAAAVQPLASSGSER